MGVAAAMVARGDEYLVLLMVFTDSSVRWLFDMPVPYEFSHFSVLSWPRVLSFVLFFKARDS